MSILAEPRRKRKICVDPQNLTWKNDTNKFGHKMLQNLGWKEGQGLGLNNQGMTENIKLKANYTQSGIGAEANSSDRTWIAHHDEFSFLLEQLNAKKAAKVAEKKESEDSEESEEDEAQKPKKMREEGSKSLEERSKATKTRIHYKFTKMKDITRYSAKDKSAVIGVGLKSKIVAEESIEKSPEKAATKTFNEVATVKNSEVSISDYFASKMKKFYAKKTENLAQNETAEVIKEEEKEEEVVTEESNNDEEERRRQKAERKAMRKAKREAEEAAVVEMQNEKEEEEASDDKEEIRRKRKERKRMEKEARALEAQEEE